MMPRKRSRTQNVHTECFRFQEVLDETQLTYEERDQTVAATGKGQEGSFWGDRNALCLKRIRTPWVCVPVKTHQATRFTFYTLCLCAKYTSISKTQLERGPGNSTPCAVQNFKKNFKKQTTGLLSVSQKDIYHTIC